uniref:Uncharacterized protein n=1 Tax=Acrobeloides nanus TaxID=290746 RepID=A0A914C5E8_9BILA
MVVHLDVNSAPAARVTFADISDHREELSTILTELSNSFRYIDYVLQNGLGKVSGDEIHEKFKNAGSNLEVLKGWLKTTKDENLKKFLEQRIPAYEVFVESGKLLEDLALFLENIDFVDSEDAAIITKSALMMLEVAEMIDEAIKFLDYVYVDENGDIKEPITPELMLEIRSSIDKMKSLKSDIQKNTEPGSELSQNSYYNELLLNFTELYFETLWMKEDPKHNPARALQILDNLERILKQNEVKMTKEDVAVYETSYIQPLKEVKEKLMNGSDDKYKDILKVVLKIERIL